MVFYTSLQCKHKPTRTVQAAERIANGTSGNPIAGLHQTECLQIGFEKMGSGKIKANELDIITQRPVI